MCHIRATVKAVSVLPGSMSNTHLSWALTDWYSCCCLLPAVLDWHTRQRSHFLLCLFSSAGQKQYENTIKYSFNSRSKITLWLQRKLTCTLKPGGAGSNAKKKNVEKQKGDSVFT